ncbi:HAMP domain-containing histidine kinase [bacterium]|nr:HAMP domain-containing histidine kinase [bacterium]
MVEHEWKYINLQDHQPTRDSTHLENVYFRLTTDGKVVFNTFPEYLREPLLSDTTRVIQHRQFEDRDGKFYELNGVMDLGPTRTYLSTLRKALWLGCILAFILALPLSFGCATFLLRPFDNLSRKTRDLTAERLKALIPEPQHKDEYALLVRSFNSLLLRLDRSFSLVRRFAVNASHEFRTPIAIITAQTEMALRKERTPEEYQQALKKVDTQAKSLHAISHMLLSLSELENMEEEEAKTFFVRETLLRVSNTLSSKLAANRKKISISSDDFEFRGKEGVFLGIANNLIENAFKYSNSEVQVRAVNHSDSMALYIDDDGQGIPENEMHRVGEPFFRVSGSSMSEGYGLGLALVSAYARAVRASVSYKKSDLGGLSVVVRFPPV